MVAMVRRSSSPRLVGRDQELADLLAAVDGQDAERQVILIAGEAGIGKTRLLAELEATLRSSGADDRAIGIVRGSCLALADGELPFAPILEILDGLGHDRPDLRARIALVSQELSGGDLTSAAGGGSRGRLFGQIRDILVEAQADDGLVMIVDDVHWADRSTLDLLVFLARRLRGTGVLLVVAYRSDELHRRHPLPPVLAELRRGFVREQLDLGPLSADAIGQQVDEIVGRDDPRLRRRIAERADGNPFHAEELVAIDVGDAPLPASLRDVLLARLRALDPATIDVLGICAVVGTDVDETLLAAVSGTDPGEIHARLREAVEHSILVPSSDGRSYGFRHALLQEAMHDDLLPADRVGLHRRVADALARDPFSRSASRAVQAAELARHRDAAGQTELAFDAYLDAGTAAYRATAWPEAAAAFQRAATIAAPDSDGSLDPRLMAVLPKAAFAVYFAGDLHRAVALLQDGIDRASSMGDDGTAAELLIHLARLYNTFGDEQASRATFVRLQSLDVPEERLHARAMLAVANVVAKYMANRSGEAIELATRALPMVDAVGDLDSVTILLSSRGSSLIGLGRFEEAAADFDRIAGLPANEISVFERGVFITNRGWAMNEAGELDAGEALLRDGLRIAAELDVRSDWDPWNLAGLGYVAFMRGDWDDALSLVGSSRAFGVGGIPALIAGYVSALVAAGRGDAARASADFAVSREIAVDIESEWPYLELTAARLAGEAGDPRARLSHVQAGLAALEGKDTLVLWSWLALHGASAAADLAASAHGRSAPGSASDDALRARAYATLAEEVASGRRFPGSSPTRLTRAIAAFASAEADRAEGVDRPDQWAAAAAAFEDLGFQPEVAELRYREAAASLANGDRDRAVVSLGQARSIADAVGMTVLGGRIDALARAGRLTLDTPAPALVPAVEASAPPPSDDPWGLTEREREVLALVAAGRTNGQIGTALFISTKTASVHVTHILDKLGVSSRTEAALAAIHAGLVEPPVAAR